MKAATDTARLRQVLLSLSCCALLVGGPAHAQTPADAFIREQDAREKVKRLDALRQATPAAAAEDRSQDAALPEEAYGPCFPVEHIAIEGVTQFPKDRVDALVAPYERTCIGLTGINGLLRDVTHLYLNEGFVASRAYVPEQDVGKTKILRILVAEGRLSDIYLNGEPAPASGSLATAFPGLKGKTVNIRDVEQGLDQINRLASSNATTTMLPGQQPGSSILNVQNAPGRPWHVSLANSNLGQAQTGYSKSSVSLGLDNPLGFNDFVSLTYEHTGPDYPWPDDGAGRSDSVSGTLSIPYGYWTVSLNGSYYHYRSTVPGDFGAIDTSGDSSQFGFDINRVILRDQDSITTLNAGLAYKQTNNFLLGNRIEVGSRQYTVASLGVSHSRRMLGGLGVFDLTYAQGLDVFGAVEQGDPGAGDADPEFAKFSGTASFTRPFKLSDQRLEFSTLLHGQYSPDNLFGAEQMSLGSYSNVRGVRDSVLFGNNGFFNRNTLAWRLMPWADDAQMVQWLGELRPYVGLDYGRVFSQKRNAIAGADIASWTAGARLVGGMFSLDVGYSRIFMNTAHTDENGLFYASVGLNW